MTAFHFVAATSDTPLVVFGDHASRHIPPELDDLGLRGDDLTRHIAWDIGTEVIVRELCRIFGCAGHLAGTSRLVVDVNRDEGAPGLIPRISDGTSIPGNADADREARLAIYRDYHAGLGALIGSHERPFVVSVHSFTPQPRTGAMREVDIGLLVKHNPETAKAFAGALRDLTNYDVRLNEPYSGWDLNHTIDVHAAELRHLAIEVRQDHIDTDETAARMAGILADALRPCL